ncbi:fumarylacetoacetate hydrolase family protein [Sulfurimonas crateris]|uniref:Fumarylacetoacetate hydrolase family protein n=1 Tax=Sulfurimonas crateris TaxID=2574727 RepID=A0A4U2ZCL4_9BACT|nr:fumarylacetoacetate hydrolase family protein [Sulfurimonas crateris]TKI70941.1 fumarylacetoacetate hydrolase family protein [Sulfurimonas crateris]
MKTVLFENCVVTPSKVVCIGRNYVEHIHELGNEIPENLVVFNKPNSSVSDMLFFISEDTRFEGEICFLIEKGNIAGVGFGLDLTKADTQNSLKAKGLPWERAKAFDSSAVLGHFVAFNGDITKLRFELFINDTLRQFATYDLMIYKPDVMLREIASFMSFEDGDIIMSGTPKGVATYKIGDLFEGKIYCNEELLVVSKWEVKENKK